MEEMTPEFGLKEKEDSTGKVGAWGAVFKKEVK